jgi:hypothetical protein
MARVPPRDWHSVTPNNDNAKQAPWNNLSHGFLECSIIRNAKGRHNAAVMEK